MINVVFCLNFIHKFKLYFELSDKDFSNTINRNGEIMQTKKLNAIQYFGLFISIIGLFFVAFPTVVGVLAIRIITLLFLMLGFAAVTFSLVLKSKVSLFTSLIIVFIGLYAFARPEYVLFLIGLVCLVSGVNGLFLTFSKFKTSSERTLISSIGLMLLGVFAIINTKAALSTVILIIGIIIVLLGIILIFLGSNLTKQSFFYTYSTKSSHLSKPSSGSRIIVKIDDDEVEEIEYKEL